MSLTKGADMHGERRNKGKRAKERWKAVMMVGGKVKGWARGHKQGVEIKEYE